MDNSEVITKVEDFLLAFTSILYEALPYIILGAVIAGVLEELLPVPFAKSWQLFAGKIVR